MNSVLVTGGNGFVGRHLVAELQRSTFASQIVVFDRSIKNILAGVEGYEIDITTIESAKDIIRDLRPTWVVHLAAIANIGAALKDPELTRTVNVFGTKSLLDVVLSVSPSSKFLVISSADIYGNVSSVPISELSLDEAYPRNPYAQSKLEMEQMIEKGYNEHCIRVRPFPHIGPGQQKGFVTADFASQIAAIETGKQPPVISVGNLTAQRDFTDVRDVVRAYRLLMEHGSLGEVYHVASGVPHSIQSVLDSLLALSNVAIKVQEDLSQMRPSDTPVLIGNANKLRASTGWFPDIPFEQSLQDILEYWRSK